MEAFLSPDVLALSIPILAIVMGIGCGMLGMYLGYLKRKNMFTLYHQERMAAIEKGIELPPLPDDFFREEGKASDAAAAAPRWGTPHRSLLKGLILLFVGVAILISLHFNSPGIETGHNYSLWALVPMSIGLAYLVYYFAVGRKLAAALEEERKARLGALEGKTTSG